MKPISMLIHVYPDTPIHMDPLNSRHREIYSLSTSSAETQGIKIRTCRRRQADKQIKARIKIKAEFV